MLRGHTAPCRAPTLRRAAPRARPLAGRGAARRLCRNARLPKQPARAPPRTAELDSVPVRASGEARARAPPRANGGAQATARRGRGHRPPAARAHACPARRGVFTPHGRGVGVAVSATRDVPHAVAEAARVCAPPRTVGADSVPQRGRQRHPRAHPPRANGGARAHRARRLDSQPAARAHVHRERWASHPPPRGGGCGQRPHACAATRVRLPRQPARARASPRANGVRRRLSSARSGCRSSPPRVRTPPRARFGGGVTPPWREGVGVVHGHTRGSEGCTPTGANADGGTVSGGETPSHGPKTKGGHVAVHAGTAAAAEAPHDPLLGTTRRMAAATRSFFFLWGLHTKPSEN